MFGRCSSIVLMACFTLMVPQGGKGAEGDLFEKSYALVIGINKYRPSTGMKPLQYPRKDAEGMAKYLKGQGFEVIELYDEQATRVNIISAMEDDLAVRLQKDDRVLIFFSGHGATRILGNEDYGYIIPYDATPRAGTWIDMGAIRNLSRKMGAARHQYFIMDACFGGQIAPKITNAGVPLNHPDYVRAVAQRPARQYLTAGGKDQAVLDGGPKGYSYFTGYLLEALEEGLGDLNGDGYVTQSELAAYLTPRASAWNQTPGSGTLPGHGQGEFLFKVPQASKMVGKYETARKATTKDYGFKSKGTEAHVSTKARVKPSFDCAKATTRVEHLLCDVPLLSVVDRELGIAYKELRARLSADARGKLKQSQRGWITHRDKLCSERVQGLRGEAENSAMIDCLHERTQTRTNYLLNVSL